MNRRRNWFLIALCSIFFINSARSQHVPFSGNITPTWNQCIDTFTILDQQSEFCELTVAGYTDIGKPLHLFIINKEKVFFPELFNPNKTVILINNAIHPGEPDGVDASIAFSKEILDPTNELHQLLDSVIFCIIPIYNVDGAMIRNGYSRTNQNGPEEYGFRGNSKNLDLNRDFIKCDSENAASFNRIFQRVKPTLFIDTHVSNGADYSYVMTLISPQLNKLGSPQAAFVKQELEPYLFSEMKNRGFEMSPYVNHMGATPESGLADFLETARYSTGYAALFQTIGFTTETHMLKPYPQRVESTYQFFVTLGKYAYSNNKKLRLQKQKAVQEWKNKDLYELNFKLDTNTKELFNFKGYEAVIEPALIGTGERLRYDRDQPFEKAIPRFRTYTSQHKIEIPSQYIIPQAWTEVIERLKWNGVLMQRIPRDTVMSVNGLYVGDVKTSTSCYEGHFAHQSCSVRKEQMKILFFEGDYIIPVRQDNIRYIIETLEPLSKESFFHWNFFDSVLQQKEWFSDYVFEEKAKELLENDPQLKKEFEEALKKDESLNEHWSQLYWIYKHSPHYESSAFRYPIYSR
jgi:hypothetical protein